MYIFWIIFHAENSSSLDFSQSEVSTTVLRSLYAFLRWGVRALRLHTPVLGDL